MQLIVLNKMPQQSMDTYTGRYEGNIGYKPAQRRPRRKQNNNNGNKT